MPAVVQRQAVPEDRGGHLLRSEPRKPKLVAAAATGGSCCAAHRLRFTTRSTKYVPRYDILLAAADAF